MAFAAAVLIGGWVGNDAATVIYRALVVMLICWVVGYGVGRIGQYVVDQRIAAHRQANPMPDESAGSSQPADSSVSSSASSPQTAAQPPPSAAA